MTSFNPPPLPSPPMAVPVARPAPAQRPPFPSVGQAVLLTLILIATQLVCGGVLGFIAAMLGARPEDAFGPGLLSVGNVLSFAITLVIGMAWGKLTIRQDLPCRSVPIALWPAAAVTILGLSVLLSEFSNFLLLVLPLPELLSEFFNGLVQNEDQAWQAVVLLCLVAPFTEEPIFRGLMLSGLLKRSRPWVAVLLTAVLFAVTHLNPWQFMPAMCLGLLFGWWFLRTRSLLPCIVGHMLNNSMPFIAASIPGLEIPGYTPSDSDVVLFQPLWFDLAGLAAFALGLAWCHRVFRRIPAPPVDAPADPTGAIPIAMPVAQCPSPALPGSPSDSRP